MQHPECCNTLSFLLFLLRNMLRKCHCSDCPSLSLALLMVFSVVRSTALVVSRSSSPRLAPLTIHRLLLQTTSTPDPCQQGMRYQYYKRTPGYTARNLASFAASRLFSTATLDDESAGKFVKSYRLDGVGQGSGVKITTDTGHTLATDVPLKMGGKDTAPQPVETLLAAWMGCTEATALFVCRQMKPRVLIDRLEFNNIEGFRDERGALQLPIEETPDIPSRLQRITGTIRVHLKQRKGGSDRLSEEQLCILQEQTEVRCPVANMILASGCSMVVNWRIGET